MSVFTRLADEGDKAWIEGVLIREWHGPLIERADEYLDGSSLPALLAIEEGERVGVVTILLHKDHAEIVTINSFEEGVGVGSALLGAAESFALENKLFEVRLFTTNDNLYALRFYQKRGYRLWAVHRDTITRARNDRKPNIPLFAANGLLIADEIELRKSLTSSNHSFAGGQD